MSSKIIFEWGDRGGICGLLLLVRTPTKVRRLNF
jgi:hypothetical protein